MDGAHGRLRQRGDHQPRFVWRLVRAAGGPKADPLERSGAQDGPSAKKWMEHMAGFVKEGIISRDSYGDWCVPPEDPKLIHSNDPARKTAPALLATAYFYLDAQLMAGYATALHK